MKKIIYIMLFSSMMAHGQADTAFRLIKTIRTDVIDFAVDNLDNMYLFSSSNQLKKLNAHGDSVAVYNDVKKFGRATYIDVSNPLRILLYYKDFLTIVILDRLLNLRSVIDLRKSNILQATAIGLSYDNNIWVYDEANSKLKKMDDQGRILLETPDFRQLFGDAPSPQSVFDQDGFVYMYDSVKGVYVFDYYGALKNKILITGWKDFRVAGKYIYGITHDTLQRYQINTFRLDNQKLSAPLWPVISLGFTPTRLYGLKKDSVEIYSIR
ncbi:MAG: hypothetical protein JWM28_1070 [Chitinophagaceae bacterium]|nr:hypothetical protein [Chitinophagaceae bacterium]